MSTTLSVFASVQEASPTGETLLHQHIRGRLACCQTAPDSIATALVAAAIDASGVSSSMAASVHECLRLDAWVANDAELPHMDVTHSLVSGRLSVHAGTVSHTHNGARLALALPCAYVVMDHAGEGPAVFAMKVHGCIRDHRLGDKALCFAPQAFLCAPGKVMELPVNRFSSQIPKHMPRHAPHRTKRMQAKQLHVQALKSLCLHADDTHTNLRILDDDTVVCDTVCANSAVVSYHVLTV